MLERTILYLLSFVLVISPIYLALLLGPKVNKERSIYFLLGLAFRGLVALMQYIISIEQQFDNPESAIAFLSRVTLSGILEELIRYPAIIIAQYIGFRFLIWRSADNNEKSLKLEWSNLKDPHGMGIYFGVGWGIAETIGFFIKPLYEAYQEGVAWDISDHIFAIIIYVTGVMAHVALTYLSMVISVNRGFYRFTIGLHVGVNFINAIFSEDVGLVPPNNAANTLIVLFTRFSIVLCAYFLLRPRARYLSPAVLLFLQVMMFLGFLTIGTIIFLFVWIIASDFPLIGS